MLDVERLQFLDLYSFELRLDYFEKILEFTSSSYSFYWLEAILNLMIYKDRIEFDEILDEMISLAYDDVVEKGYHLGPLIHQKRTNALENAILSIQKYLPENCSKQEIIICVKQHDEALKEYKKLLIMQTPYRLLSSFLVDVGGNDPIWNRPKDIIETIFSNNDNLPQIRRVINILICDFMRNNPGKKIGWIDFVVYSDEELLELVKKLNND